MNSREVTVHRQRVESRISLCPQVSHVQLGQQTDLFVVDKDGPDVVRVADAGPQRFWMVDGVEEYVQLVYTRQRRDLYVVSILSSLLADDLP